MLDYPQTMHHLSNGPPLTAHIHVQDDQITEVVLYPHHDIGANWQIIADQPCPKLESTLKAWFDAYCAGKNPKQQLPLDWRGLTSFTEGVLEAIAEIPFGHSMTYKELAQKVNNPKGARAVGNACGKNPFPWIVPCHRVLATGNRLGGFSLDLIIKMHLLAFEDIQYIN